MSDLLTPILEYAAHCEQQQRVRWEKRPGVRIDLHCHSTFSYERLRWLPGLVYHPLAEPEEVYDLAKKRGMDYVTITDHDSIDGCKALVDRRGELPDFIFGEEVSVAFPEDGTIVHINVFDHDEEQHREIQRLRRNIYDFVAYVRSIDKLYVINHLTWTAQHRVLTPTQLETILELFDVFEGLNGARSYAHNAFTWHATRGHDKTLIGGSDSHTNRVGTTYTLSEGATKLVLLDNIKAGEAAACGAFGTTEKLREDVWLVLQKNVERRMAEQRSRWDRLMCRMVRQIGKRLHPLVLLGYDKHQDVLIRNFARALPAPAAPIPTPA
jgi:predicted metal-dependent phosphoesterase TrpH